MAEKGLIIIGRHEEDKFGILAVVAAAAVSIAIALRVFFVTYASGRIHLIFPTLGRIPPYTSRIMGEVVLTL